MHPLRREWIAFCRTFPDSYEDYPFHDEEWTAMRHRSNRRTFAFLYERQGKVCINVKCEPMAGDFLKQALPWITPGYHMNKRHWITIWVEACDDIPALRSILAESYALTR